MFWIMDIPSGVSFTTGYKGLMWGLKRFPLEPGEFLIYDGGY